MSLFSGHAGRLAAIGNANLSNQNLSAIQGALGAGQAGAFFSLDQGLPKQEAALSSGRADALAALKAGADKARTNYASARGNYDYMIPGAHSSWDQLLDAGGVNGKEGKDRAAGNFQASPGYAKDVEMTNDAVNRGAAAGGQLLSGNTLAELTTRQHDLADQEYGNYYDRLQGIADRGRSAVDAQAGIDQGLAGLEANLGANEAGIQSGYGSSLAGVYGNDAASRAGIFSNTAAAQAGALSDNTNRLLKINDAAAAAGQRADTNRLNLGIALGNDVATIGGRALGGKVG